MKLAIRLLQGLLVVGLSLGLVSCGGQATQETAQPPAGTTAGAATVLGDLTKDWTAQKDTMMKIADAMPEDKFGYKSTPAQRSYGEQIMHVAMVNVRFLKMVGGTAAAPSFTAEGATTKAQILQALGDSYDYGIALLNEQTDATILQTVDGPAFMGPSTRSRMYWFLLGHTMDIYGQMAVYLRLNGLVPPASQRE
jgi:uncharacterized damage-inducible protein DinB